MINIDKDVQNRKDVVNENVLNTLKLSNKKYPDDSLALHTDLYQINMAETYWDDGLHNRRAIFEAYFRKNPFNGEYVVFAGLERIIDYINNFKFSESDIQYLRNELGYQDDFLDYLRTMKFSGNLKSVAEGEIVFANEPLLQIDTSLGEAQILETPLLNIMNFHPLIATKASRIRSAVGNDNLIDGMDEQSLMEFGTRRAHEFDAALWGTRAAYIGGFNATSNVRAGKLFGIPAVGTHAHAMVQVYGDEYTAFNKFAIRHKNCIFLVDTYDTIKSGIPNAIKVAKELGDKINFVGIRLDSGNLCELSKQARKMLDDAGFTKAKIYASNDLDEYAALELRKNGAKIDGWGFGTKLITAYDQPALGGVYKLAALEDENGNMVDTIKLSENPEKATTPGLKKILRVADLINNKYEEDKIALKDEKIQGEGLKVRDIHKDIFIEGELVYDQPSIHEMRDYCIQNLKLFKDSCKSITNPKKYSVTLTEKCAENKSRNIRQVREKVLLNVN